MMWIHIDFWFKCPNKIHRTKYYLNPNQQQKFHKLISEIIKLPLIKRSFFLYEPNPHCFLALEVWGWLAKIYCKIIMKMAMGICKEKKIKFILGINYTLNTKDSENNEFFVDCLSSFSKITLAEKTPHPLWLKKFPLKIKNIKQTAHLIHCCLNQITNSRPLERKFYKEMFKTYKEK